MASPFDFKGKTALITGAGSGIGAALAVNLAARGCHLVLLDINVTGLATLVQSLSSSSATIATYECDLGNAESIKTFAHEFLAQAPAIDLLFNNAGVAVGGRFEKVPETDFDWLMNINFYGVVRMTRAMLPTLKARPDAHIINISSVFGIIAPAGQTAYCASKFAVRGFSNSLRHELLGSTVGVSVVHPGGVKTMIARNGRAHLPGNAEQKAARLKATEAKLSMAPAQAAQQILRGVERRKARIVVGNDAKIAAFLERLMPVKYWSLIKNYF